MSISAIAAVVTTSPSTATTRRRRSEHVQHHFQGLSPAIAHAGTRVPERLTSPDQMSKVYRTFGRRHRYMGVGNFSAQCLNGRRQAMIFRLRGVALFGAGNQLVAYQPSGNGRNGQIPWLSFEAFGSS